MALQKYSDKSLYQPSISQRKIFISANTMNHVIIVCVLSGSMNIERKNCVLLVKLHLANTYDH